MRYLKLCMTVGLILAVSATAGAATWYPFEFSAADLWKYTQPHLTEPGPNPDEGAQYQANPRRHHDVWKSSGIHTTWSPYGDEGTEPGTYAGTFANWAASSAGQAYQIDSFNLWGGDFGNAVNLFGEKYLSVANEDDNGVSSWKITKTPTGWTGAVIPSSFMSDRGYPEWYVDDGTGITQADINDPSLVFGFEVLIANPGTAFETNGDLRVWFGGTAYDENATPGAWTSEGFDGVMTLTPIPEPLTMLGVFAGIAGIGGYLRKRRKA